MPGFWEYLQQFSDKLNEKQNTLFDRQFNIANMWNQKEQQESQAAQNYMGIQSGLLGQRVGVAQALGEGERFDKSYKLSQDEAAFEKDKFQQGLVQMALDRQNNLDTARINASGRSGDGNDMQMMRFLLELLKGDLGKDGNTKSFLSNIDVNGIGGGNVSAPADATGTFNLNNLNARR